jgi:formylglycine-generating enzyme required for sulfatase activity
MPIDDVVAIGRALLTALQAAHEHPMEIVHRDLKPSNVLFDEKGIAHLADFGLAQIAGHSGRLQLKGGAHPGSPLYMAPEQASSTGYLTPAADLFALGCILFEMVTDKRDKRMRPGIRASQVKEGAPAWLDDLLVRALAEDPFDRYENAKEMLAALQAGPNQVAEARRLAEEAGRRRLTEEAEIQRQVAEAERRRLAEEAERHRQVEEEKRKLAAQPSSPISFDWITIPAGTFIMGSSKEQVEAVIAEASKGSYVGTFKKSWITCELPQHKVYVPEFLMARVPVTVAQSRAFVAATGYMTTAEENGTAYSYVDKKWDWVIGADWRQPYGPGSSVEMKIHHPVTCVSWRDAMAFCVWARVCLPSETEWEKAARGTDGRIWPWGNEKPEKSRCNFNWSVGDTTPVGNYPRGASAYGLLDMAGNVWEWTSTRWGGTDWENPGFRYPYVGDDGREDLKANDSRVIRGGAFGNLGTYVRCVIRDWFAEDSRNNYMGFRVVAPGS